MIYEAACENKHKTFQTSAVFLNTPKVTQMLEYCLWTLESHIYLNYLNFVLSRHIAMILIKVLFKILCVEKVFILSGSKICVNKVW